MRNTQDYSNLLNMYCRDITKYNVLTREEEKALFIRYSKKRDLKAKNRLIVSNLRFVIQEARRFSVPQLSLMDIVAEGTIGLIKAIDKFDHTKNIHFISYAVWWIRQAILDYLNRSSSLIYIPSNLLKKIRKNDLLRDFEDDPRSRIKLTLIKNNYLHLRRLHEPVRDGGVEEEFMNFVPAGNSFSPDTLLQRDHLSRQITGLLGKLSSKERKVIQMRFGLASYTRMSLKEISSRFHLTKERIRQIQNKALSKLQKLYNSHNLKLFLAEH